MKLRLAVAAGTFLLSAVASAATSYPTREDPKPMSGTYLDYTSCAFSKEAARAQLDALLRVPDTERGVAAENGPCTVASVQAAPPKVDERDRR